MSNTPNISARLTRYAASKARSNFSDLFNEAYYSDPVIVTKHGRSVAVISLDMLERLYELEANAGREKVDRALSEFDRIVSNITSE